MDISLPIERLTYAQAMERFGSDKPDMRFGMELQDVSDIEMCIRDRFKPMPGRFKDYIAMPKANMYQLSLIHI